jgi:hypothetical protein
MVLYKDKSVLQHTDHAAFDAVHEPGQDAPNPGLYRCLGCGKEIALAQGHKLPPQNHHQHSGNQGRIRWQLAASHS